MSEGSGSEGAGATSRFEPAPARAPVCEVAVLRPQAELRAELELVQQHAFLVFGHPPTAATEQGLFDQAAQLPPVGCEPPQQKRYAKMSHVQWRCQSQRLECAWHRSVG